MPKKPHSEKPTSQELTVKRGPRNSRYCFKATARIQSPKVKRKIDSS
jgi:hypothetical protein